MQEAATPETGPADAPASAESIADQIAAEIGNGDGEQPAEGLEEVTQQLVNEAEETSGEPVTEPGPEDEATEPDESPEEPEEGNPEVNDEADPFSKLLAENPDLPVKVKVNGETIEVPLSELANGYSRTEDYKAKTAAVAEERRAVEAEKATVEQRVSEQYANQLEEATNLFAQFDPVLSEAQRIDWATLKATDPAAYVQAQDAVNERLTAIQRMNEHVAQVRQNSQQQQEQLLQQERAQRFDKAADEIVKLRPELADESKFKEFAGQTVEFLKQDGFTGEEIVEALDHRVLRLADDARQWREHKARLAALPERKVVQKSAVKPLTSDGTGSQTPKPRFPVNATREAKGNWIAQQILSEE
jgi:hypothetical protein